MSFADPVLLFSFSAVMSWLFVFALIPILKREFMDTPNDRSSHKLATPRGGGLAIVLSGSIIHYLAEPGPGRWVPILCAPLALVGLIDDKFGLPAWLRYLVQIVTAISLVSISKVSVNSLQYFALIIALTGIMNFTNFMDGLDGLVAGCAMLMFAATSSWAISGAIFGFLLWNWSPAKVFMGDVGSTFIGAVFGGLVLQQSSYSQVLLSFLVAFPLFADSTICLLRRLIANQNIFKPHRQHLFQRLNQAGIPHAGVALIYMGAVLSLVIARSFGGLPILLIVILVELIIGFYLDLKVAAKFVNA